MKKLLGIFLSAAVVFGSFATIDTAEARNGRNAAAALGLLGGVAIGAAIANNNDRRNYDCDGYGNCYQRRVYHEAPVSRRGLKWNDDKECWVSRRNYWGPCRAY